MSCAKSLEVEVKDSDFFLLASMVALAPHMTKGWGICMWAFNFAAFCVMFYLEH
jgi:hypothetical protein